jgi:hypothetical protein
VLGTGPQSDAGSLVVKVVMSPRSRRGLIYTSLLLLYMEEGSMYELRY